MHPEPLSSQGSYPFAQVSPGSDVLFCFCQAVSVIISISAEVEQMKFQFLSVTLKGNKMSTFPRMHIFQFVLIKNGNKTSTLFSSVLDLKLNT